MKLKALTLAMGLVMALPGCNDSGNDSANNRSYDFEVTAIDGYLKNAEVTVQCGDKIFTPPPTDKNGKTKVNTNGIPASECSVITTAADDGSTVDMATGKKFSGGDLYLKTPAGQDGDLVASPFTTLVAMKLESGEATSLGEATSQVAKEYDIPEALVTGDFVASQADEATSVTLQSIAVTPFLPQTESQYKNIINDLAKRDDLKGNLGKVIKAVKEAIDQAINDGIDLTTVHFVVEIDADGNVSVAVVPNGNDDDNDPTGGTGGTGTGGTAVGGGTGN